MILFLAVVVLSVLLGLALRGSLLRFGELHLRWWGLVLAGLALQFVPLPDGRAGTDLLARVAVLSCSYSLLVIFAALNVRLPGMSLVLIGLVLNAAVIVPNGGMPVSAEALERSGQEDLLHVLVEEGAAKHHLMTDDDVLTPFADVIPIPEPIGQVVSVGDVFVYAGLAWLIVAVMLGRTRATTPEGPRRYQGKHRPGRGSGPAAALPPPSATTESVSGP
jgi:hypothetical protein